MSHIIGMYDNIDTHMWVTVIKTGDKYQVALSEYEITPFEKKSIRTSYNTFDHIIDAYAEFADITRTMMFVQCSADEMFSMYFWDKSADIQ